MPVTVYVARAVVWLPPPITPSVGERNGSPFLVFLILPHEVLLQAKPGVVGVPFDKRNQVIVTDILQSVTYQVLVSLQHVLILGWVILVDDL